MSTHPDTIKSYNEHSSEWAARVRKKGNISHEHLEKPAMYEKLGNIRGLSVLCVGCGSGEECAQIKKLGAEKVVGVDISKGLIEQAKAAYPEIEFYNQDIEKLEFPKKTFDIVYSSLAMHYLSDWTRGLKSVYKVLKDNGRFLFSTHHPVYWSSQKYKSSKNLIVKLGYSITENKNGSGFEIFGDYLNSRLVKDTWFGNMPVNYYHKPLSEIFKEIREAGFMVSDFLEPKATAGAKKVKEDFYEIHQKIPLFMIFELKKQ